MDSSRPPWARAIAVVLWGLCSMSCSHNSPTVPEAEYSTKIVGNWQGTVGRQKETMSINGDGTFVCRVQPMGFLARTLSQSMPGTVYGTWKITGAVITLTITGAENESLRKRITPSTIMAFKTDELVLKSDGGETLPFRRVSAR